MNEDEPSPLHAKYFVDFVRNRKEPFANIETEVRATAEGGDALGEPAPAQEATLESRAMPAEPMPTLREVL